MEETKKELAQFYPEDMGAMYQLVIFGLGRYPAKIRLRSEILLCDSIG